MDDLTAARADWGLKDRTLSVLRALLSFLPKGERVRLTVFPSNRTLSDRLHGMPESTLRRHLAKLAEVGLIQRQSSPNGKRYRIGDDLAFGLDLTPLFALARTLREHAEQAMAQAQRIRHLRTRIRVVLDRIDIPQSERAGTLRLLRRRVGPDILAAELARLQDDLPPETTASAAQNECHLQSQTESKKQHDDTTVALAALSKVENMMAQPIRSDTDLRTVGENAAHLLSVHGAWTFARQTFGTAWATMALAYILKRHHRLRKPDRYLQTLARKAGAGGFDLIAALRMDGVAPT